VSPYIPPGSKIRARQNPDGNTYPFDHTSIIATVRNLFLQGEPQLTDRDGVAPDLLSSLGLAAPNNDGPPNIEPSLQQPMPAEVQDRSDAAPNGIQNTLSAAAATLPDSPPASIAAVPAPQNVPTREYPTVAIAHANATASTNRFLGIA
jgi:phospholipase C